MVDREAKHVTLAAGGQRLNLATSPELFSSHQLDRGTRLLLRSLDGVPATRILDLGCGYGPLGLGVVAGRPRAQATLVDRDSLAVDYARANAEANGLGNRCHATPSLGWDDVEAADGPFDLVVSNLPGKAPAPVLTHLLFDGGGLLAEGALIAVVVVAALTETIDELIVAHDAEVVLRDVRGGHSVFHLRSRVSGDPNSSGFDRGLYDRSVLELDDGRVRLRVRTVWGLPEFDSLSFGSELALRAMSDGAARLADGGRVLIVNPGQGHLAVAASQILQPADLAIEGRDLLAVRTTERALGASARLKGEISPFRRAERESGDFDLVLVSVPPKQRTGTTVELLLEVATAVSGGGLLLAHGPATALQRAAGEALRPGGRVRLVDRRTRHGFAALTYRAGRDRY